MMDDCFRQGRDKRGAMTTERFRNSLLENQLAASRNDLEKTVRDLEKARGELQLESVELLRQRSQVANTEVPAGLGDPEQT